MNDDNSLDIRTGTAGIKTRGPNEDYVDGGVMPTPTQVPHESDDLRFTIVLDLPVTPESPSFAVKEQFDIGPISEPAVRVMAGSHLIATGHLFLNAEKSCLSLKIDKLTPRPPIL